MPTEVIFPKVDMDMESGELAEWLCSDGDTVTAGEIIFVIETDKSGMDIESPASGTISFIGDFLGQQVTVGKVLAYIYAEGEAHEPSALDSVDKTLESEQLKKTGSVEKTGSHNAPTNKTESTSVQNLEGVAEQNSEVRASPAARKLAYQNDTDLTQVRGSSFNGRIVKEDVTLFLSTIDSLSNNSSSTSALNNNVGGSQIPHSRMRKTIASRLVSATNEIPSYQVSVECDCTSLLMLKTSLEKVSMEEVDHPKVSINDLFVRSLALTLRDHPLANSSWTEDARLVHESVDIGIAVALEDGLITPIVKDAANKSIKRIAGDTSKLVKDALAGTLSKSDYIGGGSTISNLGMYGIVEFTSIVNPPQASILSIGSIRKSPVVVDDALSILPVCRICFTFDHRLINGAEGARLANTFKIYVEDAFRLTM